TVVAYDVDDLYPDALACLQAVRAAGYLVGLAGNQSARLEAWAREAELPVDVIGSSASWGVRKPSPAFFERLVAEAGFEPNEVVYVGDRVDNATEPATAAGLGAVWIRRGPWGLLQPRTDAAAIQIDSLTELPGVLASE